VSLQIYESSNVLETARIASQIAAMVAPGLCITLEGDLGAGKTTFVRALVEALGGNPQSVSSPTFMLLHIYPTGRMTVYHLDAYRVGGSDDFEGIGFSELLEQNGLVVVEWASRVRELMPERRMDIRLTTTGESSRRIEVESSAPLL
jgi:tRNA threonylcarbamoyladenosine biosynthesis protein TsaE